MKLSKRILALLLALTMILSCLPVSVLAEELTPEAGITEEAAAETQREASMEASDAPSENTEEEPPAEGPSAEEPPAEEPEEDVPPVEEPPVVEPPAEGPSADEPADESADEPADEPVPDEAGLMAASVDSEHPDYLTYEWLGYDNATYRYYYQNGKRDTTYHVRPGDEYYHIYFLNSWDGSDYVPTPVKVTGDSYVTVEDVSGLAMNGEEYAEYFCKVTANSWDKTATLTTEGGVEMTVSTSLGMDSFHSNSDHNNGSFITDYTIDPEADENFFYFYLDDNYEGYWVINSALSLETTNVASMSSEGNGLYKLTLSNEYIQTLVDAGVDAYFPVTVSHGVRSAGDEENPNYTETWTLSLWCGYQAPEPDEYIRTDPHLSFRWLNNDGDGYYEFGDFQNYETIQTTAGDSWMILIFYKTLWNEETGKYDRTPVKVKSNVSGLSVTAIPSDKIADGEENGAYFYELKATQWNKSGQIYYTEGGTRYAVNINVELGETSFHSGYPCNEGNYIDHIVFAPFQTDPYEVYFRFESDFWDLNDIEYDTSLVTVTQVDAISYKVTPTQTLLDHLTNNDWRDIELKLHVTAKNDPNWTETWRHGFGFSMGYPEGDWTQLRINGEDYQIFPDVIRHSWPTGETNEWGEVWASEYVESLPEGITYNRSTNTLTLNNFNGESLELSNFGLYNEKEELVGTNFPNRNLTVRLVGDNTLNNTVREALHIYKLDVTFTGSGSLYAKATMGSEDWYPAMAVYNDSSVTFKNSVNVTVELAGSDIPEEAYRTAIELGDGNMTMQDDATVTTLLPEGTRDNGHINAGRGISGIRDLVIEGGTLNTTALSIADWDADGEDVEGEYVEGNYFQSGGTVNITSLGGQHETEVHDDDGNPTGEWIDHYHYEGLVIEEGGMATLEGGTLNIDITAEDWEKDSSAYGYGLAVKSGDFFFDGGEININAEDTEATLIHIGEWGDSSFHMDGGTINGGGIEAPNFDEGSYSGGWINTFMDLCPTGTAYFNGGTINASWTEFKLGGTAFFGGTELNLEVGNIFVDNEARMNGGVLHMQDVVLMVNGNFYMNDGLLDLTYSPLINNCAFLMTGGEVRVDYRDIYNDGRSPVEYATAPAIVNNCYMDVDGGVINIDNKLFCPAIESGGHINMGNDESDDPAECGEPGVINITNANEDHPAVAFIRWTDEEGNPEMNEDGSPANDPTGLFLADGEINIQAAGDSRIFAIMAQPGRNIGVIGGELNVTGGDVNMEDVLFVNTDGTVNLTDGTLYLAPDGKLHVEEGGTVTIDTTITDRNEDWWYMALYADPGSEVYVNDGTLTVNTENIDCAMDVFRFIQDGGTVTVNATGSEGNGLGVCFKDVFELNGGTLNVTASGNVAVQMGRCEEEETDEHHLEVNGGVLNIDANGLMGIDVENDFVINGGKINIEVAGIEIEEVKRIKAFGIVVDSWVETGEDEEGNPYTLTFKGTLTVNGGDITVTMPSKILGKYPMALLSDNSPVRLLGGTLRAINCNPVYSEATDPAYLLEMGEGMSVYSADTGLKLIPLDYSFEMEDEEGNLVTYYARGFEEDNEAGDIFTEVGWEPPMNTLMTSDKAGDNLTWDVRDGTLIISGFGDMYDFTDASAPWAIFADKITSIEIGEDVTYLGENAFVGLTKAKNLYFYGDAPLFHDNAFAGLNVTAYYPISENGWDEAIESTYGGTVTWRVDSGSISVAEILPEDGKLWLVNGERLSLTAELVPPDAPVDATIEWRLDEASEAFASISVRDNVATITGKAVTEAQEIIVYAKNANGRGDEASLTLTVYPKATAVTIGREYEIEDGNFGIELVQGQKLTVNLNDDSMDLIGYLTPSALAESGLLDNAIAWTSSNEDVATVEDGRVFFWKEGNVKITATAQDGSNKSAYVNLTVKEMLSYIDISGNAATVQGGKSLTLKALDAEGNTVKSSEIEWLVDPDNTDSDAASYITMTSAGKLTTKAVVAPVKITVWARVIGNEDAYDTHTIIVQPATISLDIMRMIDVDEYETLTGETVTVDVGFVRKMGLYAMVNPDGANSDIVWTSSNPNIATVEKAEGEAENKGVVSVVLDEDGNPKTGTVTITATNGDNKKATVKLNLAVLADTVEITPSEDFKLKSGESVNLTAEVSNSTGAKVTKPGVTWSLANSEDKNYVTLSSSGKLTAKTVYGIFNVEVQATSKDGKAVGTVNVEVCPKDEDMLVLRDQYGSYVTKSTMILDVNQETTVELTAEALDMSDTGTITWKSSNEKVIEVDNAGNVSVVLDDNGEPKTGTATITAEDETGRTATVTIKAEKQTSEIEIVIRGYEVGKTPVVVSGKTLSINAKPDSKSAVTWMVNSEDDGPTDAATISSNGRLTVSKSLAEAVTVYVTVTAKDNGYSVTIPVDLKPIATGLEIVDADDKNLTNTTVTMAVADGSLDLSALVYPLYEANQSVTWTSSSKKVAYFEDAASGELTFQGAGTTTITAKTNDGSNKKVTFKLTLVNYVEDVKFGDDGYVVAGGKSLTLKPEILPANATNKKLVWSIRGDETDDMSHPAYFDYQNYASISTSGALKTKAVTEPKTVIVTATAMDGSGVCAECEVTIYPATTKISLLENGVDKTSKTITITDPGEQVILEAVSNPTEAAGVYTWKSSNTKIATVEDGVVTPVENEDGTYKKGTITITCTAADGSNKRATVKIKFA